MMRRRSDAFTLIELMIVVAIMGIVMTIAIPSIYRRMNPESLQKAVSEVTEACSHARAKAILDGKTVELVLRQQEDRVVEVPGLYRTRIGENIVIEGIGLNGEDWTEDEVVRVRFYPNGTSDQFILILHTPEDNEWRKISLEVVTGLADVDANPKQWTLGLR